MKKEIRLNTGALMPMVGIGTYKLQGEILVQTITSALELGYRHIDTADRYQNHTDIARALDEINVPREELFVTSKLWMTDYHKEDVYNACQRILRELNTDYLDLFLIHWPDRSIPFQETLHAMQDLKDRGLIKAIGVSNFTIHHLQDVMATGISVAVNQVEFHPSLYQKELKAFCDEQHIVMTAHSPLAQGKELELPIIQEFAKKYSRSPVQIVLNWILKKGIVVIPKATNPEHLKDNLQSLEWELSEEDSAQIDEFGLHAQNRIFNPPYAEFDY